MKKRIIKLTESDLERLVHRIIKENEEEGGKSKLNKGLEKRTDKLMDLSAFEKLVTSIKTKPVDQQVEVFMMLLGKMDLKGNFGIRLKKAMQEKGLI